MSAERAAAARPRWRGQPGRLEVWYLTATDRASGLGLWLHHELVAPLAGKPYAHGWVSLFEPGRPPRTERFGPADAPAGAEWFLAGDVRVRTGELAGRAGAVRWDLAWQDDSPPLWTFPAWAWRRELLPAAQVVPAPTARIRGELDIDGRSLPVDARGGLAHIYGRGNAERWGWLHADLGAGSVLEIVAAVSGRPGLRRLPPLAFVQLRHGGIDWPRDPLLAAVAFRTRLDLPAWSVRGTVGRRRLTVQVTQPAARCTRLDYVDPDGAPATCVNSEAADAEVRLERWSGRWRLERSWQLAGSAHAEVGGRP